MWNQKNYRESDAITAYVCIAVMRLRQGDIYPTASNIHVMLVGDKQCEDCGNVALLETAGIANGS